MDYVMSGGEVLPKYTGPLARLMRAEEAAGILRTIEAILPVAQASGDMTVLRRINADQAVKVIAEANNVPAKALRTDEELEAMDAAQAEAAQMQSLLAAAPIAGQAAERFAKAEQIAASAPRRAVPGI
jgi:Trk K+ transport system NAD-binding subunit